MIMHIFPDHFSRHFVAYHSTKAASSISAILQSLASNVSRKQFLHGSAQFLADGVGDGVGVLPDAVVVAAFDHDAGDVFGAGIAH